MIFRILVLIFIFSYTIFSNSANLIKNPGFEKNDGLGNTSIEKWDTNGGNVYHIIDNNKRSGNFAVKFWWEGSLSQELKVTPGYLYCGDIWMMLPEKEPLTEKTTKHAVLLLQFIDKSGKKIINEISSEIFTGNYLPGKWYKISTAGFAPPHSEFIRFKIQFNKGDGDGVVCFDDASLNSTSFDYTSKNFFKKDLIGKWNITKGDNISYANPDYDDSKWDKIIVPSSWEKIYPDYDGFGWYRKKIKIPESLKGQPIVLIFGAVDDADITYWNGKKIGGYGSFPPVAITAWNKPRYYTILPEQINYGRENTIAIRVYDSMRDGGITGFPVGIYNYLSLEKFYLEKTKTGEELGADITDDEFMIWKKSVQGYTPSRCKVKKLENGGWTFLDSDNQPFMPIGVEYEPLALYNTMNWKYVNRDLNLIKENGFNTLTVWCINFNASGGTGNRLSIDDMVKLTQLAQDRNLYIQFYLNIDRFIHLFPCATLPDGEQHGFDIDYFHPGYRKFIRNFAKRLAMRLYKFDNVSTIVVWEEKIGVLDFQDKDNKIIAAVLYGSEWGKQAFTDWLLKKYGNIDFINKTWGTDFSSFKKAVDISLKAYQHGVLKNDHRQFDILEFGQLMLIDFTKDFVESYKSIDPAMLFQCRNYDLFGPIRTVDPRWNFLDSFGANIYTLGHNSYDISLRREILKLKLIAGVNEMAPYISNYGFRTASKDNGTHGLVPNDKIKADMGSLVLASYSFIPEVTGSSYFTYLYRGVEGPWGIIRDIDGEKNPLFHAYKSLHSLMAEKNNYIASADYPEKSKLYIFHGLDAIYDLNQVCWLEHSPMVWGLTEMNINYAVVSDKEEYDVKKYPIISALFHAYDKKLDSKIADNLLDYCYNGGTLLIGNKFGHTNRYYWKNNKFIEKINKILDTKISELKFGDFKVKIKNNDNIPTLSIKKTYYVEPSDTIDDSEILITMNIDGKTQPGLIKKQYGKGTLYYFFFNPFNQTWWGDNPESLNKQNRTSIPIMHFLFNELGIKHDTNFGNRGFDIKNGRVNVYQKAVHHFISHDIDKFGTYNDEYNTTNENYSGGVITDDFIAFCGKELNEKGWNINMSEITSVYIAIKDNQMRYFTMTPVKVSIKKDDWDIENKTEAYRVYDIISD